MFSFGLLARRAAVLLEDQRVSCQKTNALPAKLCTIFISRLELQELQTA